MRLRSEIIPRAEALESQGMLLPGRGRRASLGDFMAYSERWLARLEAELEEREGLGPSA